MPTTSSRNTCNQRSWSPCRFEPALLLTALIAWCGLGPAPAHAAESRWILPADPAVETAPAPEEWRYQSGDHPAWSAPGWDDAAWLTGSPRTTPLRQDDGAWPGLGWFRITLDASQLRQPVPLVLDLALCGAAEIFLDGNKVAQIGTVGAALPAELAVRRLESPPLVTLTPGTHVLAVRYSNFHARSVNRIDARAGGFTLRLVPHDQWARDALAAEREAYGQLMFFMAVPLVLAFLHFALFCFAPAMRESLYCALFLGALSGMTFMRLELTRVTTVPDYLLSHRLFLTTITAFSLLCLLTVYRTFEQPKRWLFVALQAIGGILLVWPLLDESRLVLRLCTVFGLVVSLEAVRVTALAVRRGRPGARSVLAGFVCFAAAVLYNTLRVFGWVPEHAYSTHTMNLGILAAALGLSFFIARNYAVTARRLTDKLAEVEELSARSLAQEREKQALIAGQNERLEVQVRERTAELAQEKNQSEELLHNILPREIALELKQKGAATPRRFEEATILFSDFSGFTSTVSTIPPQWLIRELDEIFRRFDDIIAQEGLEKIKTIGDAYMAAGGIPTPCPDHAHRCVRAALAMQVALAARNEQATLKWTMRVGLHAGPLVAGVVGKRKFTYDVFGDTVNLASRMETSATPGEINVSAYTYELVRDEFDCEYRGKLDIKGKGSLDLYTVRGRKQR